MHLASGTLPVALLQRLLQFDTTNPPGAEAASVEHLVRQVGDAGLDVGLLVRGPTRPNLVVRLKGGVPLRPHCSYTVTRRS